MEKITTNIEELPRDQKLAHLYYNARIAELISSKARCRLVIDIQDGRINSIQDQEQLAGVSQMAYKLERLGIDTSKSL